MGITVKRPVTVKAIVTEKFRERLVHDLRKASDQMALQMQQLEFQGKRYLMDLQKRDLAKAMATRKQLEEEQEKQEATRQELLSRIEQVQQLPLESEFVQGTIESLVELNVGDDLNERLGGAEVIVRDNIVVEIREGVLPEEEMPEPEDEPRVLQPARGPGSIITFPAR